MSEILGAEGPEPEAASKCRCSLLCGLADKLGAQNGVLEQTALGTLAFSELIHLAKRVAMSSHGPKGSISRLLILLPGPKVSYNIRLRRSWPACLASLSEMRQLLLQPDEFTSSSLLAAHKAGEGIQPKHLHSVSGVWKRRSA